MTRHKTPRGVLYHHLQRQDYVFDCAVPPLTPLGCRLCSTFPNVAAALPAQSGFAFALAGVAEGFEQRAVGAFGWIGVDAGHDSLHFRYRDFVGRVALVDG